MKLLSIPGNMKTSFLFIYEDLKQLPWQGPIVGKLLFWKRHSLRPRGLGFFCLNYDLVKVMAAELKRYSEYQN
jgi:hypothetical protein